MKKSKLGGALALAASLLVSVAISPMAYSMAHEDKEMHGLERVTEETLASQQTANDLIGSSVYDRYGEKIGEITDVGLAEGFATHLQKAGKQEEETAEMDMPEEMDHHIVYISVGGLMGLGGDVISAPASSLSYNEEEDRIEMKHLKEAVVAFAKGGEISGEQEVVSAKQEFDDEVAAVREAIEGNRMLSGVREHIDVSIEDRKVILRGTLANENLKNLVGEVARKHTDLDIENYIEIEE